MLLSSIISVEIILAVLSLWGIGIAIYILRAYLQRQQSYETRIQSRLTKIGSGTLNQEDDRPD
ncbi:MAG: hypothetical protein AB7G75_03605 [Candidatus Binatia bacterium]